MRKLRTFKEYLLEELKDPKYAKAYIALALEEYDQDKDMPMFLDALRAVAEAQGGLTKLAAKTNLNRQHLYRVLSSNGNPTLETIGMVLHALGFRLSVESLKASATA